VSFHCRLRDCVRPLFYLNKTGYRREGNKDEDGENDQLDDSQVTRALLHARLPKPGLRFINGLDASSFRSPDG